MQLSNPKSYISATLSFSTPLKPLLTVHIARSIVKYDYYRQIAKGKGK